MSEHKQPIPGRAAARWGVLLPAAVCICSIFLTDPAQAGSTEEGLALSLEQAVALAEKTNETLLIALEDQSRAGAAVKEAYSGILPNVQFQADYQKNFTKPAFFLPDELGGGKVEIGSDYEVTSHIRLDQTLYAFGRVGNAVEYAKIYKDIAAIAVGYARSDVVFSVKEAYYRVLLARHVAEIRRRSLEQADSHRINVEQKFSQGTASRFELLRAQVEVKNREPELISAENNVALSMQDLKRLLDIDDGPDPVLTDSLTYIPLGITEDQAVAEALAARPEIKTLELNVHGTGRILAIERAGRLPTLGLFAQVLFQGQANDDPLDPFDARHRAFSTFAGLSLTVPIFDGFRTKARIQQARADNRRAEFELESAQKAVRLEVMKAVKDLQSLEQSYEAQLATVSLAEETYSIAETRFFNGLSTQLELTDAETALDAARVNYATTLFEYDVAIAILDKALGRSTGLDPKYMSEAMGSTGQDAFAGPQNAAGSPAYDPKRHTDIEPGEGEASSRARDIDAGDNASHAGRKE
jgi:outer membrane protein